MTGLIPLSAPAALAQRAGRRTEQKMSTIEQYGMTLWFAVTIHTGATGGTDLGSWASCSGLGVGFTTERFATGGSYGADVVLPGRLTFDDVTLERAMTRTDSAAVRDWLDQVGRTWLGGPGTPPWDRSGCSATIRVFGGPTGAEPVAEWTLRNVTPVSWTAPQLSTTGGGIAMERLVLSHDGFLPTHGGHDRPAALTLSQGPGGTGVVFRHPPDSVKIDQTVGLKNAAGPNRMMYDPKMTEPGKTGITIGDLLVDGAEDVKKDVDQLWAWLEPVAPAAGRGSETDAAGDYSPQILQLTLGTSAQGLRRTVIITRVDVTYVRFDPDGRPTRAKVSLTFQAVSEDARTAAGLLGAHRKPAPAAGRGHADPIRAARR